MKPPSFEAKIWPAKAKRGEPEDQPRERFVILVEGEQEEYSIGDGRVLSQVLTGCQTVTGRGLFGSGRTAFRYPGKIVVRQFFGDLLWEPKNRAGLERYTRTLQSRIDWVLGGLE